MGEKYVMVATLILAVPCSECLVIGIKAYGFVQCKYLCCCYLNEMPDFQVNIEVL